VGIRSGPLGIHRNSSSTAHERFRSQSPLPGDQSCGLPFVASPRYAGVLLVAGPVTPGCGVFAASPPCIGAVSEAEPVDLLIRGCPPGPTQPLQGLGSLGAGYRRNTVVSRIHHLPPGIAFERRYASSETHGRLPRAHGGSGQIDQSAFAEQPAAFRLVLPR
jgi:hypothetical protein